MPTITDPKERLARKDNQLKRLAKKGWKPPKAKGKSNASH